MRIPNPFPTEKVVLIKFNGANEEEVHALVDSDVFSIDNPTVAVEEGDFFRRTLSNGVTEYYEVLNQEFHEGEGPFPPYCRAQVRKVTKATIERAFEDEQKKGKPHKVFVSHSSADKMMIKPIVEMLEEIGLPDDAIVCTSVPGHGVPGESRIFDWLREQFMSCELRVFFALSNNYYQSAASLNEMGAAWVIKATYTLMLLPGFSFDSIDGCIDRTEVGISFDSSDDELKHRLNELKETLTREYNLPQIQPIRWERHRDTCINKVRDAAKTLLYQPEETKSIETYHPVDPLENPKNIPADSAFLLVFAANDGGRIVRVMTLSAPVQVATSKRNFVNDNAQRTSARWQEALDRLIKWGWVKQVDHKGHVFELTGTGYVKADWLKECMEIDTDIDPFIQMSKFE